MKWNGDERKIRNDVGNRINGIRNGNERIIQTVRRNDLSGTGIGGLLSWWDKTA